ncbi:MAG: atpF3 [Deltaproteobacteria bacterium]|nr:atpF3 [Deltaproteobacteria bacterium]
MIDFNYTLLIQFLNFLVLLFLLNVLLFKPVLKAINKREKTLGSLFDNVDGIKADTVSLEQAYEEGSRERKRPVLEGKEAALMEAQKSSMRLIEVARTELADELVKVKAEIERQNKSIYDALKGEVEKLSTEVAEKILKRSL